MPRSDPVGVPVPTGLAGRSLAPLLRADRAVELPSEQLRALGYVD